MTPDMKVLSNVEATSPTSVPTTTHLFGASDQAQIDVLTLSDRITYHPQSLIPIPPFMIPAVHEAIVDSNGDVYQVFLTALRAIKDFDSIHNNDNDYIDKARSKSKDIIFWLYLVSQDHASIEAVPTMGCSNKTLAKALKTVLDSCLLSTSNAAVSDSVANQVERSLKRPFEVLAASSSSTSNFMEKLTQIHSISQEKSSRNFKKIPNKYQNMILVASSTSNVTKVDYDAKGANFFKCLNVLNAQIMLNSIFETEKIDCSASSAVTSTLHFGSFLWKDSISPSGLAASVLASKDFLHSDILYEGMVLDYATKFEMSETSLNKLTKSQVLFPRDVEELSHRICANQVLSSFFFTKNSFLSQGLEKVVHFCSDNKTLLKTRVFMDEKFIAK